MKKIGIVLLLTTILSLMVAGCEKSLEGISNVINIDKSQNIIKIGVIEPLTGGAASGGNMTLEGILLAQKHYPEVLGKKIELVVKDNKSDRIEAKNAAKELIGQNVSAIIGSYGSSLSMAIGEIVKQERIPVVGCSPTNPYVTLNNDYYFRVCFIDPYQGTVMAEYAYDVLKAEKAAVIYDTMQDYSIGLANYFISAFKNQTGNEDSIVYLGNYTSGNSDFTGELKNIQSFNPDVIFLPGNYVESANFIKQARMMGIEIPILGGDTWESPEFIQTGKEFVEGTVFSTHFSSSSIITEKAKTFVDSYRSEYKKEPTAFSALGYDAYIMLINSIGKGKSSDPEKIRKNLSLTKDFEGATGIITLDRNGDPIKSAVIMTVNDGKFKYITNTK